MTKGKNTAANIYRYVLDVGTSMAGVLCSVCYFKSLINETPLSESIDFQDGHFTQSTTSGDFEQWGMDGEVIKIKAPWD